MKRFIRFFWSTVTHPRANFDALASESTVRWAIIAAVLPILQIWGNVLLHTIFGLDWLGTRPLLDDPTFVGGFGHWRVSLAHWVAVFVALMPLLSLLDLVFNAGVAHLMSKLWGGQGTFDQMVNTLTFAWVVPNMLIAGVSEWVFSVPINLITGEAYWWNAAMQGELGTVTGIVWNTYVFGVYLGAQWIWIIVLGTIAIRRVQRIPLWSAVVTMVVTFSLSMFLSSVFVR